MELKKSVFISHCSKDKALADEVCRVFEETGLGCWIAPRDIPYGEEWATEITDAIFSAEVMLLVLTANSNASPQVVREINLAIQSGLKLVPLYIDGEMPKGGLNYYLSSVQGVVVRREELQTRVSALAEGLKNGETVPEGEKDDGLDPEEELEGIDPDRLVNVDEELDAKFAELFGQEREENPPELSPFKQKLMDRICERVVEKYSRGLDEPEEEIRLRDPNEETGSQGDKYFSMTEEGDIITAFLVRIRIDEGTHRRRYVPEKLECVREEMEDGSRKTTFFAENVDYYGNPLVVLHFLQEKKVALINMAFLDRNAVKLSKKPMPVEFRITEETEENGPKIFRVNETSGNYIVDPDTAELVERKKYYDRKKKRWIHYMELVPHKKYFSFQLKAREETAPALQIARGYFWGRYGLKKNLLSAAEWFEEAGTPESWYYLGRIFNEDPLLSDPEDAAEYLGRSARAGEERAKRYMEKYGIS